MVADHARLRCRESVRPRRNVRRRRRTTKCEGLDAEQAQREHAELTSALAEALRLRTYDRFAPTRLVVTPPATTGTRRAELPISRCCPAEGNPAPRRVAANLRKIAQASREFPRLQGQAAEANHRIGDIRQRLGRF